MIVAFAGLSIGGLLPVERLSAGDLGLPERMRLTDATRVTRLMSVSELPDRFETKASLRAL